MDESQQIGRLALRQEGGMWNAYYALNDSMDDAVFIGSIKMAAVVKNKQAKEMFKDLMREVVADILEDAVGVRPGWAGEKPAPEHERAGHS